MSSPNRSSTRPNTAKSPASGGVSARSGGSSKYVRDCICGRGLACIGMTQAFRLLGDPRCYYVELPRFRKDPPAYKYVFRNNLRAAYLRHLKSSNPSMSLESLRESTHRHYVALHHFHPSVIKSFYENPLTSGAAQKHKVPISITEHELQELQLEICEEDRILSVTGVPTGGYYFCPSYNQTAAHNDLKELIKKERAVREAQESPHSKGTPTSNNGGSNALVSTTLPISTTPNRTPIFEDRDTPGDESAVRERSTSPSNRKTKISAFTARLEAEAARRREEIAQLQKKADKTTEGAKAVEGSENDEDVYKEDVGETQVEATVFKDPSISTTRDLSDPTLDTGRAVSDENADFDFDTEGANNSDFNSLWEEDIQRSTEARSKQAETTLSAIQAETEEDAIVEEEDPAVDAEDDNGVDDTDAAPLSPSKKSSSPRKNFHPWETPKYRKQMEETRNETRAAAKPAAFIDPSIVTSTKSPSESAPVAKEERPNTPEVVPEPEIITSESPIPARPITTDAASAAQKSAAAISAAALSALKSIDEAEHIDQDSREQPGPSASTSATSEMTSIPEDPPGWSPTRAPKVKIGTPSRINGSISENQSVEIPDSTGLGGSTIFLSHHMPGSDPTLRIQVHNDLIAWESKRRTEISKLLDYNCEKWRAARTILNLGSSELETAERLVLGFAKAGNLFSDSLKAVYDDKLLDDAGNMVSNSFLQNRLYKQRVNQEYSIEATDDADASGQSALLGSILEAQKQIAGSFDDCSQHIKDEIYPEIKELRVEVTSTLGNIGSIGDSIVRELKRSEVEVKNIWDVFDAMVTGDLMEYSVHGSMHGGSQHGGSLHSFSQSGSLHGLNDSIVSSVNSPLVKSTFKQLGALEDGWVVEMFYRCAVAYQRAVFAIAEKELDVLVSKIAEYEEHRFRKLHQILLAFVPRQRRLFNALPDHLKDVLNQLVGLRIDEESLQNLIDESIKGRSHDRLKKGASHRSSIMNRSRVKLSLENGEAEVDQIENLFGDPFKCSTVLLSKVVEMQLGGLRGIVNTSWMPALVVVTAGGKFLVFSLPADTTSTNVSPSEAFRLLYPDMSFGENFDWSRKTAIVKSLSPGLSLEMIRSNFSIPKMQHRQIQVVEENAKEATGNRFMKAMKAAADSQRGKKVSLRLSSPSEVDEWIKLLERTKKLLKSKN